MKRQDLIDKLCYDDDGTGESPYPLECLYDLEGRSYVELKTFYRAVYDSKGERRPGVEAIPLDDSGAERRQIVEVLGAPESDSGPLASRAAQGLDQLRRALARFGLPIPRRGRDELLEVATRIYAAKSESPLGVSRYGVEGVEKEIRDTVRRAAELIAAVDLHVTQEALEAEDAEVD